MKSLLILSLIFLSSCSTQNNNILDSKCSLKPDTGMCRAAFPKYYFDNTSNSCEKFIWGGCNGVVPFNSFNSCKKTCEG